MPRTDARDIMAEKSDFLAEVSFFLSTFAAQNNMKTHHSITRILVYLVCFLAPLIALRNLPNREDTLLSPWVIDVHLSLLFTLLVFLTARLAKTNNTGLGVSATAAFLLLFCPGSEHFFNPSEESILELGSQCITPFFIGQYTRIRTKDFHYLYFLMLLMGIFCSYTHNGITIPLCVCFLWLSFRNRRRFFRLAAWPMVIGFVIGTWLSLIHKHDEGVQVSTNIESMTNTTSIVLTTLWETKVFIVAMLLTAWLTMSKRGRSLLLSISRRNYIVTVCFIAALCTVPLAPLGIDNAVTGVCFFCMFWVLFVSKHLIEKTTGKKF